MKPLIAITTHFQKENQNYYSIYETYSKAIELAGGVPVFIPILSDVSVLEKFDGFLISGGGQGVKYLETDGKLPSLREQNPERYDFEIKVINYALENNKPLIGICRGCQTLNESQEGTTIDIKQISNSLNHRQTTEKHKPFHQINIRGKLKEILQTDTIEVNSVHSQAIDKVAKGFKQIAKAKDNITEAIESTKHDFVIGLQFHPEKMLENSFCFIKIFQEFINKCNLNTHDLQ